MIIVGTWRPKQKKEKKARKSWFCLKGSEFYKEKKKQSFSEQKLRVENNEDGRERDLAGVCLVMARDNFLECCFNL